MELQRKTLHNPTWDNFFFFDETETITEYYRVLWQRRNQFSEQI